MLINKDIPFFIAEISANHLGSFERAKQLVAAAAVAGADAVKFQTYTADSMTLDLESLKVSDNHELWGGRTLYSLYEEASTPWEWHKELFDFARQLGLVPFSSPFSVEAVDFLETLDCPMYKIASLETSDHQLIRKVASTQKPIIISTGATEWNEIEALVNVVRAEGNEDLTLLLCTSSYPADPADANLNRIERLRNSFGAKIGISDHTLGLGVTLAAIGLGATVVEKHITLRRSDGGADGAFSMEPNEFREMVFAGRDAAKALGSSEWSMQASEQESRRLRRSLYIVKDVKEGEEVTMDNIRAIRPGQGMSPSRLTEVLGKKFKGNFVPGTPLQPGLVK